MAGKCVKELRGKDGVDANSVIPKKKKKKKSRKKRGYSE